VPNVPLYLLASLVLGAFFAACLALFTDVMDDKITSFEGVEEQLGVSLLGVLPAVRKPADISAQVRKRLLAGETAPTQTVLWVNGPATSFAESLQALRTKLLLSRSTSPPKVILVTSSVSGEGKSTVSANLSSLLARSNKKVLLVQADMRGPSTIASLDESQIYPNGLSVLLTDSSIAAANSAQQTAYGMQVIFAGPRPPCPAELLGSERMSNLLDNWKAQFDFIVLDSPPLLAVTDAAVLSHFADMTILVARPSVTSRTSLKRGYELIAADKQTRVGVVINAVDIRSPGYDEYYGYSGSVHHANVEDKVNA
jgi:capsular exopolysaccharide synthesis family protein